MDAKNVAKHLPSKKTIFVFSAIVALVISLGFASTIVSRTFVGRISKSAQNLSYSSRSCTSLRAIAGPVVERLRKRPGKKIDCSAARDAKTLLKPFVPIPTAAIPGYYEIMTEMDSFLRDVVDRRCSGGEITFGEIADEIERGVSKKC